MCEIVWEAWGGVGEGQGESQLWWRCWQDLLHHAYTWVSLSLPLFGLTCLDIKSAPSALNTLGPSVSPAPYWIG